MNAGYVILGVLLLSIGAAWALPPDTLWTADFGGANIDFGRDVALTTDGGYLVVGYSTTFTNGARDFWVVKVDAAGDSVWSRNYGGPQTDYCYAIEPTPDGGYILAGWTSSFPLGNFNALVIKINANGDSLWSQTYAASRISREIVYDCFVLGDGSFVLAGYTGETDSTDFWLVKADALGNELWQHAYGTNSTEECRGVQPTTDGGFILAGWQGTSISGVGDSAYVVKTDASGNFQWERSFGGPLGDFAYTGMQGESGYFIVGFTDLDTLNTQPQAFLTKLDLSGNLLWMNEYGNAGSDAFADIHPGVAGGLVVCGWTAADSAATTNAWLAQFDEDGNYLWGLDVVKPGAEQCYRFRATPDGGYVMAGFRADSTTADPFDYFLVRTDIDPCLNAAPLPPEELVIITAGDDAHLHWKKASEAYGNCPLGYHRYIIYAAPQFGGPYSIVDATPDTFYVHSGVAATDSVKFYRVTVQN